MQEGKAPEGKIEQLARPVRHPRSLVEFFRKSPLAGSGIDLDRAPDHERETDL